MEAFETRTPPARLVCPPSPFFVAMLLMFAVLFDWAAGYSAEIAGTRARGQREIGVSQLPPGVRRKSVAKSLG
jgi:hypothetical protein